MVLFLAPSLSLERYHYGYEGSNSVSLITKLRPVLGIDYGEQDPAQWDLEADNAERMAPPVAGQILGDLGDVGCPRAGQDSTDGSTRTLSTGVEPENVRQYSSK